MKPLFEIGEEVILYCKDFPEVNGMAVTIADYQFYDDWVDGATPAFGYVFYEKIPYGRTDTEIVHEKHLRPKPKGSGKTLTRFMESLKDLPVTV